MNGEVAKIAVGERIFFTHHDGYGGKKQASGIVLEIAHPASRDGTGMFVVGCDTPNVWFGTGDEESKTRIVYVPQREVWRLR